MKINNHRHGFVMIQIIIAILISISVVSGTAFVAYEAGQESAEKTIQPETATTTETEIESVPDSAPPEDETVSNAEPVEGEPSEPIEPEDTPAPSAPLTTATTSTSTATPAPTSTGQEEGEDVDGEPEATPIETGTSTTTSASVGITTTPPTTSPTTSTTKNLKESALVSITKLIDSYSLTTKWIDSGIMPLLSERERMINGLISNTQKLMENSPDPLLLYVYELFIDAYNIDKSRIVDSYRNTFSGIKDRMNTENIAVLDTEHKKFSATVAVSEAEYDALTQLIEQYENDLQSVHNEAVKSTLVQYVSRSGASDGEHQRLWAELPMIISDPANSTQSLEKIFNQLEQLRFGQPEPLN